MGGSQKNTTKVKGGSGLLEKKSWRDVHNGWKTPPTPPGLFGKHED